MYDDQESGRPWIENSGNIVNELRYEGRLTADELFVMFPYISGSLLRNHHRILQLA